MLVAQILDKVWAYLKNITFMQILVLWPNIVERLEKIGPFLIIPPSGLTA